MKHDRIPEWDQYAGISVLSVEPYGMKLCAPGTAPHRDVDFSALGRAVWDETHPPPRPLRREPNFSALGRAVWDETPEISIEYHHYASISVLSVEPYGMKPRRQTHAAPPSGDFSALGRAVWDETVCGWCAGWSVCGDFSALGRAVWDETVRLLSFPTSYRVFQCSRSSRMG